MCGAPVRLICIQQASTLMPPHTRALSCPGTGNIKLLAQTEPMGGAEKQELAAEQEPSQVDVDVAAQRQHLGDARELRVALARTIGALRNACVGAASSTAELLGGEDPTGFAEVSVV